MAGSEDAPSTLGDFLRRLSTPVDTISTLVRGHPHFSASGAVALLSSLVVLGISTRYPHPTGTDPGQWLSAAQGYLGRSANGLNPAQYPPLFFLLLAAAISLTGDGVAALWLCLGVIAFLLPMAAYFAYSRIAGDKAGALAFCAVVAFGHTTLDMLAWGGYPNFLAFSWFLVALTFFHKCATQERPHRDAFLFGVFAALTVLTHVLAGYVLVVTCGAYLLALVLCGFPVRFLLPLSVRAGPVGALMLAPYLLAFVALRAPAPSYLSPVEDNSIAIFFYPLVPEGLRTVLSSSMNGAIAGIGAVVALSFTLFAVVFVRARAQRKEDGPDTLAPAARFRPVLLFVANVLTLTLTPLALWFMHTSTDFARLAYFLFFPASAALVYLLAHFVRGSFASGRPRGEAAPERRETARLLRLGAALVVVSLLAGGGLGQYAGAARFNHTFDTATDAALVDWAKANAAAGDSFLFSPQDDNEGALKWFPGLTGYRTLGYAPPGYMFFQAERDLNLQLSQVFAGRRFADNGQLMVTQDAVGEFLNFDVMVSTIEPLRTVPVVGLLDSRHIAVLPDGSYGPLARAANQAPTDAALPFTTKLEAAGGGVAVVRTISVDASGITIRYAVEPGSAKALLLTAFHAAEACSRGQDIAGVVWRIKGVETCDALYFRGAPSLEVVAEGVDQDFLLNFSADGVAQLRIEDGRVDPPHLEPVQVTDSWQFLVANSIDFIVLDRLQVTQYHYIVEQFAGKLVYTSTKYVVLSVDTG